MNRWSVVVMLTLSGLLTLGAMRLGIGGHERGNGGDTRDPWAEKAWFSLPERDVVTCVEIAKDFGVGKKEVALALEQAITTWKEYFKAKHIRHYRRPSLAFDVHYDCPVARPDLTIYLGSESDLIAEARDSYDEPLGFAHRIEFNLEEGWGRGFIWIKPSVPPPVPSVKSKPAPSEITATGFEGELPEPPFPDWRRPNALLAILIHELGHVIGVRHTPNTIMDESIAGLIRSSTTNKDYIAYLARVDHGALLISRLFPGDEITGFLGGDVYDTAERAAYWFEKLTGHPSEGPVRATLRATGSIAGTATGISDGQYDLELADGHRTVPLAIRVDGGEGGAFYGERRDVFATVHEQKPISVEGHRGSIEGGIFGYYEASAPSFMLGTLRLEDGRTLRIGIAKNLAQTMDARSIVITLIARDGAQTLFSAHLPHELPSPPEQ